MRKRNGLARETRQAFNAGVGAIGLGARAAREAGRTAYMAGRTMFGMLPHRRKR